MLKAGRQVAASRPAQLALVFPRTVGYVAHSVGRPFLRSLRYPDIPTQFTTPALVASVMAAP